MVPDRPAAGDEASFYEALGRVIQVARTEQGLSRKELAALAGISYASLADIETARRRPSSSALIRIASALGMEPSELLSRAERYRARAAAYAPLEAGPPAVDALSMPPSKRAMRRLRSGAGRSGYPPAQLSSRLAAPADIPSRLPHEEREALRREGHALIEELSDADLEVVVRLLRRLVGRTGP